MHNRICKLLLACVICSVSLCAMAAEFIASVENNKIAFGQSVQLKLELLDAKATGNLDVSVLAKDFTIYNQQQFSSYSNVNGVVRAENGWNITILPKRLGVIAIPEISIHTNMGLLTTKPIQIEVEKAKPGSVGDASNSGISLVASTNKSKAYVNEPVIYTLKIISYKPIANVVLDDVKSNDAIVEKVGEPKQYDQLYGGMRAHIIEIRYAITGLKPGKTTIPPVLMQGELQVPATRNRYSMFSNMLFDNMFELKPFSMQSEAISFNVLPPVGTNSDWLPLHNLTVSQTFDVPANLKVGDTITRKVKITAKGGFAKQLPSVKEQQQVDNVKVYANKPTFIDKFDEDHNMLIGVKEEEFSIVPQADGDITFPEIKIKWWNLKTNKVEISKLPAKAIHVAPSANTASTVTLDFSNEDAKPVDMIARQGSEIPTWLYITVGVVLGTIVTLCLVLVGFIIKKRISVDKIKPKSTPSLSKQQIVTIEDLRVFITEYAVKHWQMPNNLPLNRLGDVLTANNYLFDIELYTHLMQNMNKVLYARHSIDLDALMAQWEDFKKSVTQSKHYKRQQDAHHDFSTLNPT